MDTRIRTYMADSRLVVNAEGSETRVGLVEGGQLVEFLLERGRERGISGNLYKARVSRVLPGMQAAFVDLGPTVERKAYLYVADILGGGDEGRLFEGYDSGDSSEGDGQSDGGEAEGEAKPERRKKRRRVREPSRASKSSRKIEELVKEGQEILVQITKEPVGNKGARVTGYVSLPGRHCVLMPTLDKVGVSHRVSSEGERRRLRDIVNQARPRGAGFIVRTAADGADAQEIRDDVDYLVKLWDQLGDKAASVKAPALLYADLDLLLRCIRDLLRDNVSEIMIDSEQAYERARRFCSAFMPKYVERVKQYQGRSPIFDAYNLEEQLRRAIHRRVPLRSGGSLVIDQGEALTAIDVNTGSFVGKGSGDLEDTITKNNLEACGEVARQLRLRNLGGIIVVDFVDMDKMSNRKLVWEAFNKELAKDSTKSNVTKISELGLVEMTRKRTRESLMQQVTDPCPTCEGRGIIKSVTTLAYEILRELRKIGPTVPADRILVECPPKVAEVLDRYERGYLDGLEKKFQKKIDIRAAQHMPPDQYKVEGRTVKVEEPAGGGPKGGGGGGAGGGGKNGRRRRRGGKGKGAGAAAAGGEA
jgi:ribonuclease G